jgi:hypothetical protein
VKDQGAAEVFTTVHTNPVNNSTDDMREFAQSRSS